MNKFDFELSQAFDITSAWFKRYIEFAYNLKQQNLKKDQKYLYAKHHIIPKFWYKDNNVEINNSNDNLIVVTHIKIMFCFILCLLTIFIIVHKIQYH